MFCLLCDTKYFLIQKHGTTEGKFTMEKINDHLKDISEIRSMMERSSKFLSLSGLAGVSAGIAGLLGAGAVYMRLTQSEHQPQEESLFSFIVLTAAIVLFSALGLAIFFTTRMARKKGLPVWSQTTKDMLANLLLPLSAGGAFCLILWYHGLVMLIGPATLLFYGLALLNTGNQTLREVRVLALAQIILGLLAALFLDHWLIFWAVGFGALHIVYGIFMYVKYEK